MTEPDYKALRNPKNQPMRYKMGLPREVAKARHAEMRARNGVASQRAKTALTVLHPDDYRSLYLQAKAEVNEERGPLPGDELGAGAGSGDESRPAAYEPASASPLVPDAVISDCQTCAGTGLVEGWPLLPGDPVVTQPMTWTAQNPAPFHRCPDCDGGAA